MNNRGGALNGVVGPGAKGSGVDWDRWQKEIDAQYASRTTAPKGLWEETRELGVFVYRSNPFYLISALLFFYAINLFFNTKDIWIDTATPLGLIGAYAVLMTATAVLIVRIGAVWDDARSISLIVVALLLFLSMSFDTLTIERHRWAPLFLPLGFGFAVMVSAALKAGLRVKLPTSVVYAYYALLALFFFYPYWPSAMALGGAGAGLTWSVALFPVAAAALFLPLLPMVRKGAGFIKDTGVPWTWPRFPWIVFAGLWLAACFRTYLLTLSFVAGKGVGQYWKLETPFGMYLLIPLVLVALLLLLEHALTSDDLPHEIAVDALMIAAPIVFYCLTFAGLERGDQYYSFLATLVGWKASPLPIAAGAGALFYGYAWWRKVKAARLLFGACALVIATVEPIAGYLRGFGVVKTEALLVAGLIVAVAAFVRKSSSLFVLGAVASLIAGAMALSAAPLSIAKWNAPLIAGLFYVSVLFAGTFFRDRWASFWERVAAFVSITLALSTLMAAKATPLSVSMAFAALTTLAALPSLAYFLRKNPWQWTAGAINAGVLALYGVYRLCLIIGLLERREYRVLIYCAAFFVVALVISLVKGDAYRKRLRKSA